MAIWTGPDGKGLWQSQQLAAVAGVRTERQSGLQHSLVCARGADSAAVFFSSSFRAALLSFLFAAFSFLLSLVQLPSDRADLALPKLAERFLLAERVLDFDLSLRLVLLRPLLLVLLPLLLSLLLLLLAPLPLAASFKVLISDLRACNCADSDCALPLPMPFPAWPLPQGNQILGDSAWESRKRRRAAASL